MPHLGAVHGRVAVVFRVPDALRRRIRDFTDSVGIEPVIRQEITPVIVVDAFNDVIPPAVPGAVLPATLSHREFTFLWVPMGSGTVITVAQNTTDQSILSIPIDSPYRYRVESLQVTMRTGTVVPDGSASPVSVYLHPFQVDSGQEINHGFDTQFWGAGMRGATLLASSRFVFHYARNVVFDLNLDENFGWIADANRGVLQAIALPDIWLAPGGALRVSIAPGVGANKDISEVAVLAVLTGVARG